MKKTKKDIEPQPSRPTMKPSTNEELEEQFDANVTKDERELLEKSADSTGTEDDELLQRAELDDTDDDGTPLNENSDDLTGEDLDVPGEDEDDSDEYDEENNSYSLNDDKEDDINTRD